MGKGEPAFQQSRAWVFIAGPESVAIHYMLCREREGEERKDKIEIESPAADRSPGVVWERSLAFRMKATNERDIEAPEKAGGRKEGRRLMSDGKGDEREAKEKGNESRIKERKTKRRKGSLNKPLKR